MCVPFQCTIAGKDLEDALACSSVGSQVLPIDQNELRTPERRTSTMREHGQRSTDAGSLTLIEQIRVMKRRCTSSEQGTRAQEEDAYLASASVMETIFGTPSCRAA